jgi:hypothetical protein
MKEPREWQSREHDKWKKLAAKLNKPNDERFQEWQLQQQKNQRMMKNRHGT